MSNTQEQPKPQIVWDEEHTVKLIMAYKAQNVLWNPENRAFLHRNARYDAWKEMANIMQLTIYDVKRKMNSLIAVYRSQCRKGVPNPRWWASHMSFMQPKLTKKPKGSDHSENSDNSFGNEHYDREQEFISVESTQRPYLSAYHEFRAEFESTKVVDFHAQVEMEKENEQEKEEEEGVVVEQQQQQQQQQQQKGINAAFSLTHADFVQVKTEREEYDREPDIEHPPEKQSKIQSPADEQQLEIDPDNLDNDDVTFFVKYLECKLKKYPTQTRNVIQFEFNRIIYEADLGLLEQTSVSKHSSSRCRSMQ